MMQLSLVVLTRDERVVLRALGELGVLQLTRTEAGPDTGPLGPHDRSQELARCTRLLTRVDDLRRSLEITHQVEPAPQADLTLQRAEEKVRVMEEEARAVLQRRQQLRQRWGELTAVGDQVSTYRGLDLPLEQLDDFSFLHFVTGSLPIENLQEVQNGVGEKVALLPLPEQHGRQPLIAMTTREGRSALESLLQQAGFQRERLPKVKGATAETLSRDSLREGEQAAAELKRLNADIQTLADQAAPPLAEIEQLAEVERGLLEAEQDAARTEAIVLLRGWVPVADAPALEQHLREITSGRCVIETTGTENLSEEQIPVLLNHKRLLRPFEMLVGSYGLPDYHELVPTLFVAISYVLMFGMMFGDAGHGAVLALGGLAALLAGRTAKVRDVGLLLLSGGLSSVTFGTLYGSFFGIPAFKKYALWHDPLEGDLMSLMYGAVGIGVVMISLGLILNIINRFRRGDMLGGVLDKFGVVGLLFYWGMLALITKYAAIQSLGLVKLALALFLVVPIVGWVVKGPLEYALRRRAGRPAEETGGMMIAVTESLLGAFEGVMSYLANTISFVRLAAYAMSHTALLLAAFMMAAEVKHVSPGGSLLSLLVIILGNLVAIVLEGIIASVQALRLEYYEFFGKFFSGGGRPFKPFRLANNSVFLGPENIKVAAVPSQ